MGTTPLGLAEGVLYAKCFGLLLGPLLLSVPGCFKNVVRILNDRVAVRYLIKAVALGYVSLGLYAYAQSRLPGIVISIILTTTPLSYSVALDYLKNKELSWAERIKKYIRDPHIHVHLALSFGVGSILYFQSDEWYFEPIAGLCAFLVPGAFFFGYIMLSLATEDREGGRKRNDDSRRVAGVFLSGLLSTFVYIPVALLVFVTLEHDLNPSQIPIDVWVYLGVSTLLAGFLGHLFYFITVNKFEERILASASLLQHLGPVINFVIAFAIFGNGRDDSEFSFDYIYLTVFISISLIGAYFYINRRGSK